MPPQDAKAAEQVPHAKEAPWFSKLQPRCVNPNPIEKMLCERCLCKAPKSKKVAKSQPSALHVQCRAHALVAKPVSHTRKN